MKLADFGLARSVASLKTGTGPNPILTDYVATRWYRAPEILLGSNRYTKAVDMWSVGCILGELLLEKPMFPGTSTMNQLDFIMQITGKPTAEDMEAINSSFASKMLENIGNVERKSLSSLFPKASPEAMDLLEKLMTFNPDIRLTAEEALEHPYVAMFHNEAEEVNSSEQITIPLDDNTKLPVSVYRERLYAELSSRRRREQRRDGRGSSSRLTSGGGSSSSLRK